MKAFKFDIMMIAGLIAGTSLYFSMGCGSDPKSDPSHYTTIGQTQIFIVNESDFPNDRLNHIIAAVNSQLTNDVNPTWGKDGQLVFLNPPSPTSPHITIKQDLHEFPNAWHLCTGFHRTGLEGFVDKNECENELVFSVTLSHEALEMLVNPNGLPTGYEICDPVGGRLMGYSPPGFPDVIVSDFVYPPFYDANGKAPFDKTGQVTKPLTPAPGYQIFSSIQGNRLRGSGR